MRGFELYSCSPMYAFSIAHDLDLSHESKSMNTTITSKKNFYPPLKALTIFNLAARTDGRNPPTNPITTAKMNDEITIDGDNANENDNSANELKFNVETVKNCKNDAKNNPTTAPIKEIKRASDRNAVRILLRLKPSERIVPISTVRLATAEYIVIIAPIIAPMLNMTVINIPSTRIKVARNSDCSSKNFCSIFGSNCTRRLSVSNASLHFSKSLMLAILNVSVDTALPRLKAFSS